MKKTQTGHCDKDALLLYYYAELDEQHQLLMEQHIDICESCNRDWRQLKKTLDTVTLPSIEMDSREIVRFAARVTDKTRYRSRSNLWLWGGALTASAVLVLSLIIPQGKVFGPEQAPETDVAMARDLELLQHLELLQDLDLLQGLEGQG